MAAWRCARTAGCAVTTTLASSEAAASVPGELHNLHVGGHPSDTVPAVAPGGLRYAVPLLVAGAVAVAISPGVAVLLLGLGAFVLLFYRDPDRSPPEDGIVAPADGTVQVLRETDDGRVRVGVFMNVWHVHVNRAPLPGRVTNREHVDGAHRPAFTKESARNERVHLDFETEHGETRVTLIAGAFARRIHPYLDAGDDCDRGQRISHISFGSRADVLLPPAVGTEDVVVARGESVTAGETIFVPERHLQDDR